MGNWLGIGAVNGALLWGTLLIASPIIIHLLSRRKFRILDWAAMEFLLEAERRNRRRIRLEHLILLLLRCLAILLLAFLVARLFLQSTGLAGRAIETARIERLVLLDDSPSMDARLGTQTVFEEAKRGLVEFVRQTAREHPGDTLTLVLTSQPRRPVLSGQYLTGDKVDAVVRTIEGLEPCDKSAAFDVAFAALEQTLTSPRGNLNRALTVITDLRRRDWLPGRPDEGAAGAEGKAKAKKAAPDGPLALLKRLAERVDSLAVVNVGGPKAPNLAVAEITFREKALLANVPAQFEVVVTNWGDGAAAQVPVTFTAGDAVPLRATIDLVDAGARATVPFTLTFKETGSAYLRAEIPADPLPRDNVRHMAARIRPGIPMLLVDGEPSSEYGQTETFYVERALAPPGLTLSGNDVTIVTENQFEELPLDRYQVIVLANVYRVTDGRRKALEAWVNAGGGLLLFLGDQVDEAAYNEKLWADGAGLLPLRLTAIAGDESQRQWVHLSDTSINHPVLRIFEGTQNPFLRRVKFFRWWNGTVRKEDLAAGRVQVLASYSDTDASPAIAERVVGNGRVLAVTSTGDAEWNTWPADPSYLVTVLEMARYATRQAPDRGTLAAGAPIRADLDPSVHSTEVQVEPPGGAAVTLQAAPADDGQHFRFQFSDTARSGLYHVRRKRHDGGVDTELFAANVESTEGDLTPAEPRVLRRQAADTKIVFLEGRGYLSQAVTGAKGELWRGLLLMLVVTLCVEQTLGWWFGRRRDTTR
ncbi:MAG TPA: BatA domain-containing protein [Planctomycetota bacterium]|nr:BatA domain-containing protein [Planctomycetota bacterium]